MFKKINIKEWNYKEVIVLIKIGQNKFSLGRKAQDIIEYLSHLHFIQSLFQLSRF